MKTLYIDSVSGISGNMMIGALLDLGADREAFERELKKLAVDGYELLYERRMKNGIDAFYFNTRIPGDSCQDDHDHHHDH
ncbi:MAG: DUF111 family protein, partial [Tissierellia bacterium]|nr:DUF111 family protein [Tissierellia bacterium]